MTDGDGLPVTPYAGTSGWSGSGHGGDLGGAGGVTYRFGQVRSVLGAADAISAQTLRVAASEGSGQDPTGLSAAGSVCLAGHGEHGEQGRASLEGSHRIVVLPVSKRLCCPLRHRIGTASHEREGIALAVVLRSGLSRSRGTALVAGGRDLAQRRLGTPGP